MRTRQCMLCGFKWELRPELDSLVDVCPKCGEPIADDSSLTTDYKEFDLGSDNEMLPLLDDYIESQQQPSGFGQDPSKLEKQLSELQKAIETDIHDPVQAAQAAKEYRRYSKIIKSTKEKSSVDHSWLFKRTNFVKDAILWIPSRVMDSRLVEEAIELHELVKSWLPDPMELGAEGRMLGKMINNLGLSTKGRIAVAIYFIACGLIGLVVAALRGKIIVIFGF